jgi:alcohol dehydrogenase class IV
MAKLKLTFPEFRHAPSVICGTGSVRSIATLDDGTTAFFTSAQPTVIDLVNAALARGGGALKIENHFRKFAGEPTHEAVVAGAAFLRSRPFRRIVAVGGGSVLDWARLAWAVHAGALDASSGVLRNSPDRRARPELWLVPTTCATGAEAADVAVFRAASGSKVAAVAPAFLADKVVLDGRFLESIPPQQLSAFLCDALSHALEAAVSLIPVYLAKETALSAFKLVVMSYAQLPSSARRDRLMEASFLAGTAASNCSVGIVHAFAHSVGVDGVGHGLANACALIDGLEFNAGTQQMDTLVERLGLPHHQALVDSVSPIVDSALESVADHGIARRLQIASRMATDVAMRSNPRRASMGELETFVRGVAERVRAR